MALDSEPTALTWSPLSGWDHGVLAVGLRDGTVALADPVSFLPPHSSPPAYAAYVHAHASVTSLAFTSTHLLAATDRDLRLCAFDQPGTGKLSLRPLGSLSEGVQGVRALLTVEDRHFLALTERSLLFLSVQGDKIVLTRHHAFPSPVLAAPRLVQVPILPHRPPLTP